jgi:formate hydrogenlyase subunit 3/multisubunit Na+/H+ antiporter MnhD subunit
VVASILICAAGAVLTAAVARWPAVAGALALATASVTAALVGWGVVTALSLGPSPEPVAPLVIPWLGFSPRFHVDGLSSVFLGLAALLAVPASLHSIGYLGARHPGRSTRFYYPCLLLFLSAMSGLVSTTDMMWFFFVFWQLMTLPGYALIRYEGAPSTVRAANRYLAMMQIACAATMVGAEILVAGGGAARGPRYDFDAVSARLPGLLAAHPGLAALAFGLFLAGFGIKMGMWPFGQVWLPDAHPAAPSPVSAMLSGVMIKTGVYGLLRYFLWLVPPEAADRFPLAGWGAAVAVLGTLTLFTGTAQALQQERSKRLLAYHSIGQVGYILLGSGAAMALLATGDPGFRPVAALALFGALYHVVNHGIFKALLFLDAGSMLCATGSQELDRMGGLMRHMPVTGATALVASFAISGVPLFNGFASKWSLYVSAFLGSSGAWYLAPCALVAVLTSTLTLASFVKFLGVGFLTRRSAAVVAAAGLTLLLTHGFSPVAAPPLPGSAAIPEGPAGSLVVYEYSDYLCPYCARIHAQEKTVVARRPDVRLVRRFFPLDATCNPAIRSTVHEGACDLARGGICAEKAGRFEAYDDAAFAAQASHPAPEELAGQIGLDPAAFHACLTAPETQQRQSADVQGANELRVNGTPSFLVRGELVTSERFLQLLGLSAEIKP